MDRKIDTKRDTNDYIYIYVCVCVRERERIIYKVGPYRRGNTRSVRLPPKRKKKKTS